MTSKLVTILPYYLHSAVGHWLGKDFSRPLPSQIAGYFLLKRLSSKNYPFGVGLYRKAGKRFVIKFWLGSCRSRHYFALRHEITVVSTLSSSQKPSPVFPVPYVETIEQKSCLGLVTDYVKGRPLSSVGHVSSQVSSYLRCVDYLRRCRPVSAIPTKHWVYILLALPFITAAALINSPGNAVEILKGVVKILTNLSALAKSRDLVLVHGDLHLDNIILSGRKFHLTDFEQSVFTYPQLELITTLSSIRNPAGFLSAVQRLLPHTPSTSALLAYNSIYNLTGHLPAANMAHYAKLLRLANQQ